MEAATRRKGIEEEAGGEELTLEKLMQLKAQNERTLQVLGRLYEETRLKNDRSNVRPNNNTTGDNNNNRDKTNRDPHDDNHLGAPKTSMRMSIHPSNSLSSSSHARGEQETFGNKDGEDDKEEVCLECHRGGVCVDCATEFPVSHSHSFRAGGGALRVEVSRSNNSNRDSSDSTRASHQQKKAISKSNQMWEDFVLDDYVQQYELEEKEQKKKDRLANPSSVDEWQWGSRITIPKPFKVASKPRQSGRKSRSQIILEQELALKQAQEEEECQKSFKATPIPASTSEPRFALLQEESERKRQLNKEIRLMTLKSMEKPFRFSEVNQSMKASLPQEKDDPPAYQFKAKPVPYDILKSKDDNFQEEEEYRRIRIQMNAIQKLQQASLPPRMQQRADHTSDGSKRKEWLKRKEEAAFLTDAHTFHPKINKSVPDFHRLQAEFEVKLENARDVRASTVPEPFSLRESVKTTKTSEELSVEDAELTETRWPYVSKRGVHGSLSHPHGPAVKAQIAIGKAIMQPPTKPTHSSKLLQNHVRANLEKQEQEKVMLNNKLAGKERRERQLWTRMEQKVLQNDPSDKIKASIELKTTINRRNSRIRELDYQRKLNDIYNSLEERPFLLEGEGKSMRKSSHDSFSEDRHEEF